MRDPLPADAAIAVISLCGAIVLALLELWLRRKAVKDSTLIFLAFSLLSQFCASIVRVQIAARNNGSLVHDYLSYYFSPLSSIFMTIAAFRLARVRDVFRREDLQSWPKVVTTAVAVLSLVGLALRSANPDIGRIIDAVASSLALTVLAGGLVFSFYKYGNQLLAGLTGVVFPSIIAYQFLHAVLNLGRAMPPELRIADTTMLILLFIALGMSWGLSETSRLRIVGAPTHVAVIAMFLDLRGSTRWSRNVINGDYHYAGTFIDELRRWVWRNTTEAFPTRPNLVKFLGDGFLFIWEIQPDTSVMNERMAAAAELASQLFREYPVWTSDNKLLWKEVPTAIGIGLDIGSAMRLTFENGSEDYLGEPINNAAKMQDLARPSGGVVIRQAVWEKFESDGDLSGKFLHCGDVKLGEFEAFPIRATNEVACIEPIAHAVVAAESFTGTTMANSPLQP